MVSCTMRLNGKHYMIEADKKYSDQYVWTAYRQSIYGGWEKIPSWTRSEVAKFPKSVAKAASEWVNFLNGSKA